MASIGVIEGIRPNSYIYHRDGFHYHWNKQSQLASYFVCRYRQSNRCNGRAILYHESGEFVPTGLHNHQADELLKNELRLRKRVLKRCRSTMYLPLRQILNEERARCSIAVASRVTMKRMRSAMQRARMSSYPNIPNDLDELSQILHNPRYAALSSTLDHYDNIFAGIVGSANNNTRSIIFISRRMAEFMSGVKIVFADGTFSSRPSTPATSQVYNIVTLWNYHIIPLVICLMEGRTTGAYKEIVQFLKRAIPDFNPRIIITDFEKAEQKSWKDEFPNVRLQGCLWHYARAVIRNARGLGLSQLVRRNDDAKKILRLCCAIPLAPQQMLRRALLSIIQDAAQMHLYNVLQPLFVYIFHTWFRRRNVALSVFGSKHRTNNACESFNQSMAKEIGLPHPNIFQFINCVARLENTAVTDIHTLAYSLEGVLNNESED